MTTNILPIFWNLASSSKDTRIPASAELISSLEGFQRSYLETKGDKEDSSEDEDDDEKDDEDDDEEDSDAESGIEVDGDEDMDEAPQDGEAKALDKALDKENADDVVYAVKRLIRGLGSSRDSSRLGFAVALTEVSLSHPLCIAKLTYSFWPVYLPYRPHKLSLSSFDHLKPQNPTKGKRTGTSFSHVFSVLPQS
jgi:DNA polymerase phi